MTHLSHDEIVDLLVGRLSAARRAHLDDCDRCRGEVSDLEPVLERATSVEVPEPSPLFWDHLATRVRDAVADQPLPSDVAPWWRAWAWPGVSAACAVLLAMAAVVLAPRSDRSATLVPGDEIAVSTPTGGDVLDEPESRARAEWDLVLTFAVDVELDEDVTAGLALRAGATDLALEELSLDERRELARLLRAELDGPKL